MGTGAAISLKDVMFLVHPKPKDEAQAAVWKQLLDRSQVGIGRSAAFSTNGRQDAGNVGTHGIEPLVQGKGPSGLKFGNKRVPVLPGLTPGCLFSRRSNGNPTPRTDQTITGNKRSQGF